MIIDPQSYVPVELDRRVREAAAGRRGAGALARRRVRPHRGPVLRFAAWATGRTAYI